MSVKWESELGPQHVKFYPKAVLQGKLEDGTDNYINVPYVHIVISDSTTINRQANDLDIRNHPVPYQRYRDMQDALEAKYEGQPLHTWPRVDPASLELLFRNGVHTVQQLVEIKESDHAYKTMPHSLKAIHSDAVKLLDTQRSSADNLDEVKALEMRIVGLQEVNEELEEEIKILKAELATHKSKAKVK